LRRRLPTLTEEVRAGRTFTDGSDRDSGRVAGLLHRGPNLGRGRGKSVFWRLEAGNSLVDGGAIDRLDRVPLVRPRSPVRLGLDDAGDLRRPGRGLERLPDGDQPVAVGGIDVRGARLRVLLQRLGEERDGVDRFGGVEHDLPARVEYVATKRPQNGQRVTAR